MTSTTIPGAHLIGKTVTDRYGNTFTVAGVDVRLRDWQDADGRIREDAVPYVYAENGAIADTDDVREVL